MRDIINKYLDQFDLDIRKSNNARFVDQKCTPDIVCFMADCVMNMIATKPVFVINDVWDTRYFIQNSRVIFNKPWANDKKAYNEYNKVLPQIAHYVENLILLTATQHNTKAHPNNKTQQINKDYQLVCLLAKADTIERSLRLVGDKYYRKESFVYVINTGLKTDFSTNLTFNEIKTKLVQIYNAA